MGRVKTFYRIKKEFSKIEKNWERAIKKLFESFDMKDVFDGKRLPVDDLTSDLNDLMVAGFKAGRRLAAIEIIDLQRNKALSKYNKEDAAFIDYYSTVPNVFLQYFEEYSSMLIADLSREINETVSHILYVGARDGKSYKEITDNLWSSLSSFRRGRCQVIARTELSKTFNKGRMEVFKDNSDIVIALEYSALLDGRTTEICSRRHGLICSAGSSYEINNTPPLHYQCRSIWLPLDKYTIEDEKLSDKIDVGWSNLPAPMF